MRSHFASVGIIGLSLSTNATATEAMANITVESEEIVNKAAELSGTQIGDHTISVVPRIKRIGRVPRRNFRKSENSEEKLN